MTARRVAAEPGDAVVVRDWRRLLGVMCLAGCFVCSLVLVGALTVLSAVGRVAAAHVRVVRLRTAAALAAARAGVLACVLGRRGRRA